MPEGSVTNLGLRYVKASAFGVIIVVVGGIEVIKWLNKRRLRKITIKKGLQATDAINVVELLLKDKPKVQQQILS